MRTSFNIYFAAFNCFFHLLQEVLLVFQQVFGDVDRVCEAAQSDHLGRMLQLLQVALGLRHAVLVVFEIRLSHHFKRTLRFL